MLNTIKENTIKYFFHKMTPSGLSVDLIMLLLEYLDFI